MEIQDMVSQVESSDIYLKWKKNNSDSYLCHALNIVDGHTFGNWQFGYFNKARHHITVFELSDPISISPESEVFQEEKTLVKPLEMEKVKIDINQAIERGNQLRDSHYSHIVLTKTVLILQNIEHGLVWNITFVGKAFEIINVKISAADNAILSHNLKPLFESRGAK